jgi:hypothetical protein
MRASILWARGGNIVLQAPALFIWTDAQLLAEHKIVLIDQQAALECALNGRRTRWAP